MRDIARKGETMRPRRDDAAASEVVGSVLLVALSVVGAGALSALVLATPGPIRMPHIDIVTSLDPGPDRLWNTSDERVLVAHRGGEPMQASQTRVSITTPRADVVRSQSQLAFSGGSLRIGQVWEGPALRLAANDSVSVRVVTGEGAGTLLADATLVVAAASVGCASDVSPPSVASWTQTPSDVTTYTTGGVTIAIELIDACAGVDPSIAPRLFHRINGTSAPAFASTTMTSLGAGRWNATILPGETWEWRGGARLEYYVGSLRDLRGNEGTSPLQTELVESVLRYPASSTATTGTMTAFSALQNGTDSGAVATLRNAQSGGTLSTHNASGTTAAGAWLLASSGYTSDDLHATTTASSETVRYTVQPTAQSGPLEQLVLRAEVSGVVTGGPGIDKLGFQLQACITSGCTPVSPFLQGSPWVSGTDAFIAYDVTSLRPGGGNWTWSDLNSLELRVTSAHETGTAHSRTWRIDRAWAEAQPPGTSALLIETTFAPLSAASFHVLEARHRTENATYRIEVWNGTAWNARGNLTNATLSTWSLPLTQAEADQALGSGLRVRFAHATVVPAGALMLDHVRVRSS